MGDAYTYIVILALGITFGLMSGGVASKRGRSAWWALLGFFLGLIGLVIVGIFVRPTTPVVQTVTCPDCGSAKAGPQAFCGNCGHPGPAPTA
jgi:hypothetical protein